MSKHTEGPWSVCGDCVSGGVYIPANPKAPRGTFEIAKLAYSDGFYPWIPSGETKEANARLIAAAPDLLSVLDRAADFISGFEDDDQDGIPELMADIRAAIAKAKGGE